MKQKPNLSIKQSMDALSYYRQMQWIYTAGCGGYLDISESDETYNNLNREVIAAYRVHYGAAYLGSVNYYGEQQQRIAAGTESIYEVYNGQPLCNFCCSFCVPLPDPVLEKLIRRWNNALLPRDATLVKAIMKRISQLEGLNLVWY